MSMEVISMLVGVVATVLGASISLVLKDRLDTKIDKHDDDRVAEEVRGTLSQFQNYDNDILALMLKNVSELREYYVISKRQANRTFTSTLIVCFAGFIIFIAGIVVNYMTQQNIIVYTTIAGSVVEIISGLFFWLYSKSMTQFNFYHERLGSTEKYLTAIQLVEKLSPEKRDAVYEDIIKIILDTPESPSEPINKNVDEP